jgi:hypothetical protein
MINDTNHFDLTKEVALLKAKLPVLPKRPRKNLFEILKIQHREIRNSNILAYFLDPNEEHGFGALFFESLKEIAASKINSSKSEYPENSFNDIGEFGQVKQVRTEEYTSGVENENKSIDIVLEGDDWIIGIENKIHHHLSNPLNTYWSHLVSKKKIPFGILLTLFPYNTDKGKIDDKNYFLNITHKEFIETVQQNIKLTGDISSTDLFYLREYFKSIENHYFHLKPQPVMDTLVHEITENYNKIEEILKKKEAAEKHIDNQLIAVFSEFDYVKADRWFRRGDKKYDLYFDIAPASELMKKNIFRLCFEIGNDTHRDINKTEFINHFRRQFADFNNFKQDNLNSVNHRTHAFIYEESDFFQKNVPFIEKMRIVLDQLINIENSPVKQVEKYLEERKLRYSR